MGSNKIVLRGGEGYNKNWGEGIGVGRTNERPGTDHVISGPMRGLKKTAPDGADRKINKQTDRQTNMATLWLIRPSGLIQ